MFHLRNQRSRFCSLMYQISDALQVQNPLLARRLASTSNLPVEPGLLSPIAIIDSTTDARTDVQDTNHAIPSLIVSGTDEDGMNLNTVPDALSAGDNHLLVQANQGRCLQQPLPSSCRSNCGTGNSNSHCAQCGLSCLDTSNTHSYRYCNYSSHHCTNNLPCCS